jgi:hypothetical protein
MKKLSLLVLLMVVPLLAQPPDPSYLMYGMFNERMWLKMERITKNWFVIGYINGVSVGVADTTPAKEIVEALGRMIPNTSDSHDTVDFLDTFFQTPENRSLPIHYGILIFVMKLKGQPDSVINDKLRNMRSMTNQIPAQ